MESSEKITLPRDAEGREIPLDTKVMYFKDGSEHKVAKWAFYPYEGIGWVADLKDGATTRSHDPGFLYLAPPDSWEKLLEDLDRCINGNSLCMYYSPSGNCSGCTIFGDKSEGCAAKALGTIKDRIRKLAEKEG